MLNVDKHATRGQIQNIVTVQNEEKKNPQFQNISMAHFQGRKTWKKKSYPVIPS